MRPMLFSEADRAHVDDFIADDEWVMEQKMDGTRGAAMINEFGVAWYGAGGQRLAHTAATQHLAAIGEVLKRFVDTELGGTLILDGEIMITTGEYRVFDVYKARFDDVDVIAAGADPLVIRREFLEEVVAPAVAGTCVSVVPQARGTVAKQAMYDAVRTAGAEGVMVKRLDLMYHSGERTGAALKVKLVRTADVVVMGATRGRNADTGRETGSAALGVFAPEHPGSNDAGYLRIGACSLIGKGEVGVGEVVEVAYLYWTGSALYQPRMVAVRHDKSPVDCTLGQFATYSRDVVA